MSSCPAPPLKGFTILMKWLALRACVMVAALPLYTAAAALPSSRLADTVVSINFAVVPGKPLLLNQRPQFSFSLLAAPGQPIHEIVAVANGSRTTPLSVTLAVGDAVTPPQGGGLSFQDVGTQHQIGRWTNLNTVSVTVPPYRITYVPMTVTVPAGARPGDYEGSISATTVGGVEITQGRFHTFIHTTKRCLVYLRVAGHASAGVRIVRAGLVSPYKAPILAVALKNTGTLIAVPTATVMTFQGPQKTYTLRAAIGTIVAGASTTIAFNLSRALPRGAYKVSIAMSYNVRPTYGGYSGPFQQMQTRWSGTVVVA